MAKRKNGASDRKPQVPKSPDLSSPEGTGVQPVARELSAEQVAELLQPDELPAGDGTDTTSETAPPEEDDLAKLFDDNDPGIDGAGTIPPEEQPAPENTGAASELSEHTLDEEIHAEDGAGVQPVARKLSAEEVAELFRTDELPAIQELMDKFTLFHDKAEKLLKLLAGMERLSADFAWKFLLFLEIFHHSFYQEDEIFEVIEARISISAKDILDLPETVERIFPGVSFREFLQLAEEADDLSNNLLPRFLKFLQNQEKKAAAGPEEPNLEVPPKAPKKKGLWRRARELFVALFSQGNGKEKKTPEPEKPKTETPSLEEPASRPEKPEPKAPEPERKEPVMLEPEKPAPAAPGPEEKTGKAKTPAASKSKGKKGIMIISSILALLLVALAFWMFHKSSKAEVITFTVAGIPAYISKAGDDSIKVQVPFNTNLGEALVRVEVSPKATSGLKDSTMVNFVQGRKNFEVVAGDKKTTKIWHVVVTKSLNKEAKITLVDFPGKTTWHADGNNITAVARPGVDITKLSPIITISEDASIDPSSGAPQDFLKGSVTYKVTAQDGTTKEFVVAVEVAEPGPESRLGKWEGVCNPLFRQIFADPAYWGYKGPDDNEAAMKKWSEGEAFRTAMLCSYVSSEDGSETRVVRAGVYYVLVKYDNGKKAVIEYDHGKQTDVNLAADSFATAKFAGDKGNESHLQSYEYIVPAEQLSENFQTTDEVGKVADSGNAIPEVKTIETQSQPVIPAVGNEDAGQVESKTPSKSVSFEELKKAPFPIFPNL